MNLPEFFGTMISSIGAPVGSMFYSLDCSISKVTNIPLLYVKLIWLIFSPLVYYISLLMFGTIILVFIMKVKP